MADMSTINLNQFRSSDSRIFSGRDRGREVRRDAKLDTLDRSADKVVVIVPDDVYSVNSSFFLGLFTPSIERLGEQGFRRKYVFEGKNIERVIDEGIRVTLTTSSPLQPKGH